MSSATNAPKQHVPAWKRLGLKLKYAQDTTNETTNQPALQPSPSQKLGKRGAENNAGSPASVKSAKKQKISTAVAASAHDSRASVNSVSKPTINPTNNKVFANGEDAPSQHDKIDASSSHLNGEAESEKVATATVTTANRRKSVTFTPDTKTEDTDSARRLFNQWSAAEGEQTLAIQTSAPIEPAAEVKPIGGEKKTKPKSQKRAAQDHEPVTADPASDSAADEIPEYVRYLQQYHNDKAHWKFNKNKQKDLLKNLFNVQKIPPAHDNALIAYLKGLGGAAAQQRLIEDAEGVFKSLLEKQGKSDDIEGMASSGERRAAYEAALRREIATFEQAGVTRTEYSDQQLQEIRRDTERGKRAHAILVELLSNELAPPQPTSSAPTSSHTKFSDTSPQPAETGLTPDMDSLNGNAQKKPSKRRKRKARTEASSDESSSDSSDSEGE